MSKISLSIDTDDLLPSYNYDGEPDGPPESLQALVIEAAARQIIRSENFDHDVKQAVKERIDDEVTSQVESLVKSVIEEPIQRTTAWGEHQGKPTTVREIVREHVEKWFSEKPARNTFGGSDRHTLTSLVQDVARNVMDKELKDEVDRVRREVSTEIRDKALRAAVEAISPRP